ncbi:MAG: response regulator, partial [Deltaproteobacteria bacterium]|nr:response regulator [Deltaproteobacteria bacterium]
MKTLVVEDSAAFRQAFTGETGFELTRRIKARHPEMLVVILTDYNLPEYRTAAFNSGADDFVVKGTL